MLVSEYQDFKTHCLYNAIIDNKGCFDDKILFMLLSNLSKTVLMSFNPIDIDIYTCFRKI